jgi:hypothetical protein
MAHARMAGEIDYRDSLQTQRPRSQQVKTAVPGEIVDARGCFEEDDRRARGLQFLTRNSPGHRRDFQVIEPADQSAFDALGEKIS